MEKFTYTTRYDPKTDRGNIDYYREKFKINLLNCPIYNYLVYGTKIQGLTKTLEEKRPKLGLIASYDEVSEALAFVIKNYSKI